MRRRLAAGNWKMNGTAASLSEVETLLQAHLSPGVEILLCPPATLIARVTEVAKGSVLKVIILSIA